jgi:hypothetical protein
MPWKRRVLAKLTKNKETKTRPWNRDQLGEVVEAPKGSMNNLLDVDRDPPQLTSVYADQISIVLGVTPPVLEEDGDDPGFPEAVLLLRQLTPESLAVVVGVAAELNKKKSK